MIRVSLLPVFLFLMETPGVVETQSFCGTSKHPTILRARETEKFAQNLTFSDFSRSTFSIFTECHWMIMAPDRQSLLFLGGSGFLPVADCKINNLTVYEGNVARKSHLKGIWCGLFNLNVHSSDYNVTITYFSSYRSGQYGHFVLRYWAMPADVSRQVTPPMKLHSIGKPRDISTSYLPWSSYMTTKNTNVYRKSSPTTTQLKRKPAATTTKSYGLRVTAVPPGSSQISCHIAVELLSNLLKGNKDVNTPNCDANKPTVLTAASTEKSFESPGYPNQYSANCTSYWIIVSKNPGMNITLLSKEPLQLDDCPQCSCSSIRVFESKYENGIKKSLRMRLPPTCSGSVNVTTTSGSAMVVFFKSGSALNLLNRGFKFSYEMTNITWTAAPERNIDAAAISNLTTMMTPAPSKRQISNDHVNSSWVDSKMGAVVGWALGVLCMLLLCIPVVIYLCTRKSKQVGPLQCQVSFSQHTSGSSHSTQGVEDRTEEEAVRILTAAQSLRQAGLSPYHPAFYSSAYSGFVNPAFLNPAWMAEVVSGSARPPTHPAGAAAAANTAPALANGSLTSHLASPFPALPPSYESVQHHLIAKEAKKEEEEVNVSSNDASCQESSSATTSFEQSVETLAPVFDNAVALLEPTSDGNAELGPTKMLTEQREDTSDLALNPNR